MINVEIIIQTLLLSTVFIQTSTAYAVYNEAKPRTGSHSLIGA